MESDVFEVPAYYRYLGPLLRVVIWSGLGVLFFLWLRRFHKKAESAVGSTSGEGVKLIRAYLQLVILAGGALWLVVFVVLLPDRRRFETFRLSAEHIAEMRIDVYEQEGAGRWKYIRTVLVSDRAEIGRTIRLLRESGRHSQNHESVVDRFYYLRFRDGQSPEWRSETLDVCPTTDRGSGPSRVGRVAPSLGLHQERVEGPLNNMGPYFASGELADWIESLVGSPPG